MEKVEGELPQSALGSTLLTLFPESKIHVASIECIKMALHLALLITLHFLGKDLFEQMEDGRLSHVDAREVVPLQTYSFMCESCSFCLDL